MSQGELIGTVVHGYRIESKLGAGGMGQVFIARHELLPKLVCVKTLLPEFARVPQIRDRFFDEARIVAGFDHRNIITIENFGELPSGELFLMMPLLHGRPLDDVLHAAGKLGPHHTLQIAAQIASALQYAHARNIIHRDLKPGNVYLERKGNHDVVKLLDFGIAKDANTNQQEKKTRAGSQMGTPSYMACEQYDDAASVGPQADIFALAVVLVEMLTGRRPWAEHEGAVLYFQQKTEPPTLTADIPRAWVPIILAALSPDPARRPQSARAFVVALANELPALPPIWGSGAKIVKDAAPDLITEALPEDETVRAKGSAPPSAIPIYPTLASDPSAPMPASYPSPSPAYAAPSMPATANERPPGTGPKQTTLSASSGASHVPAAPARPRSTTLLAIGIITVLVATGLIVAVTKLGGRPAAAPVADMDAPAVTAAPDAAVAPTMDATETAVVPVDAASAAPSATDAATVTAPPVDAAVDANKPLRHVTTTRKRAHGSQTKTATKPGAGSAAGNKPEEFDPNAPGGED